MQEVSVFFYLLVMSSEYQRQSKTRNVNECHTHTSVASFHKRAKGWHRVGHLDPGNVEQLCQTTD
jgi:hypothetical protein